MSDEIDFFQQHTALKFLRTAISKNRLAQSYIFAGPEGIGKIEIARFFTKLLQCLNRTPDLTPCCVCKNCKKIEQNIFVDNLEMTYDSEKTVISIEQVREVLHPFMRYSANEGGYKVCIINPAHKMKIEAQNTLLKILEEPPENFIFILVTSNKHLLLNTILSRCQMIPFVRLANAVIEKMLIKHKSIEEIEARIYSSLSGGKIKYALKFIESDISDVRESLLQEFITALDKKNLYDFHYFALSMDNLLKKIKEEKEDTAKYFKLEKIQIIESYIEILLNFTRDIFLLKISGIKHKLTNQDYKNKITELEKKYTLEEISQIMYNIFKSTKMLCGNARTIHAFDNILIGGGGRSDG